MKNPIKWWVETTLDFVTFDGWRNNKGYGAWFEQKEVTRGHAVVAALVMLGESAVVGVGLVLLAAAIIAITVPVALLITGIAGLVVAVVSVIAYAIRAFARLEG